MVSGGYRNHMDQRRANITFGAGKYTYELDDGWAKLPEGWSFADACGLAVDSEDRVYVLNRSEHPVIVFDREGNFITSWGEGFFQRAHGSNIGADGSIYCTDDGHHIVSKFTPEGKLLARWGSQDEDKETALFAAPHAIAVDSRGDIYVGEVSKTQAKIDKGARTVQKFVRNT